MCSKHSFLTITRCSTLGTVLPGTVLQSFLINAVVFGVLVLVLAHLI